MSAPLPARFRGHAARHAGERLGDGFTGDGATLAATTASTHVFLCTTPFHLLVASAIRDWLDERRSRARYLLAYASDAGPPSWMPPGWSEILTPPRGTDHAREGTQRRKVRLSASLAEQLMQRLGRTSGDLAVYYPHLEDYLANHLYFHRRFGRQARFYVLPDGALNYYGVVVRHTRLAHQLAKSCFAATRGLRFRPFAGKVTGLDRTRTSGQFALSSHVSDSDRAIVLDASYWRRHLGAATGTARHGVLIVGQEADMSLIAPERFLAIWRRAAQAIGPRYSGPWYYKPHPEWRSHSPVVPVLRDAIPSLQVLAAEDRPVELLVGQMGMRTIVSALSSALLNCKLVYGDQVDAVSIGSGAVASSYRWPGVQFDIQELLAVFRRVGVEMLEV